MWYIQETSPTPLATQARNDSFLENGVTDFEYILSSVEAMDPNNIYRPKRPKCRLWSVPNLSLLIPSYSAFSIKTRNNDNDDDDGYVRLSPNVQTSLNDGTCVAEVLVNVSAT
jgi:hypothetical protein